MTWTNDELGAMLNGLKLETTIAKSKTFAVDAGTLPLVSIRKALEYGFQRWLNDRVGGSDTTAGTKVESTSLFLATVLDGTWVDGARKAKASVDLETQARRNVVLANMEKADKKRLADLDDKAAKLDAIWDANADALGEAFDEELARLTAPKKRIAVKVSF